MQYRSVQLITVDEEFSGQRLDNFLLRELKGLPRSRLYRLLRTGEVRVNKKRCKPSQRLCFRDQVRIPPLQLIAEDEPAIAGDNLKRRISEACLYEDKQLIIFDKPAGIAVHGGSGVRLGFIEAVRQSYPHAQSWELVHRIDRDTSGCIMISKKRSCLRYLHGQFRAGKVDKTYWALVNGLWHEAHRVSAPLLRINLPSGERMVRVSEQEGKASQTDFRPLQLFSNATLVEAKPITGRTHQIRVHAQKQGHPLAGDAKYASDEQNAYWKGKGLQRLFLHAHALRVTLDDGTEIRVEAKLPQALQELLGTL